VMEQKTLYFGETELANRIMQMDDPGAMQQAGRLIQNFDQERWDKVAYDIVHMGNLHKFLQNVTLLGALKDTEGTTLVRASPFDRVWGIGSYSTDPAAQRRETWRGSNLLGEILTDIRGELMSDENVAPQIETEGEDKHWSWLYSHECQSLGHVHGMKGKTLQGETNFDWDELAGDPATLDNEDTVGLNNMHVEVSVPEKVTQPRKSMSETERQPLGFGRPGTVVLPENQQTTTHIATGTPNTSGFRCELPEVRKNSSKGEKSPDFDIMYEAERILKQRNKKNGTREFMIRWVSKNATDSWAKEQDISDELLLH